MCLLRKVINGLFCHDFHESKHRDAGCLSPLHSPLTLQNGRKLADTTTSVPKVGRKCQLPGKVCANAALTSHVLQSSRCNSSSPPI